MAPSISVRTRCINPVRRPVFICRVSMSILPAVPFGSPRCARSFAPDCRRPHVLLCHLDQQRTLVDVQAAIGIGFLAGPLLVGLLAAGLLCSAMLDGTEGKPFSFTDGIGVWPTTSLRLLAFMLCVIFCPFLVAAVGKRSNSDSAISIATS